MQTTDSLHALLEIERRAEKAMQAIEKDEAKLSARIAVEIEHVNRQAEQETEAALAALREKTEANTASRINAIQEAGAKKLEDFKNDCQKQREEMLAELFMKVTTWTP